MKKAKFLFCLLATLYVASADAELSYCECGSFETGVTQYFMDIEGDQGCCTGMPMIDMTAYHVTYTLREGVWEKTGQTPMTTVNAMNKCCKKD